MIKLSPKFHLFKTINTVLQFIQVIYSKRKQDANNDICESVKNEWDLVYNIRNSNTVRKITICLFYSGKQNHTLISLRFDLMVFNS